MSATLEEIHKANPVQQADAAKQQWRTSTELAGRVEKLSISAGASTGAPQALRVGSAANLRSAEDILKTLEGEEASSARSPGPGRSKPLKVSASAVGLDTTKKKP